MRKAGFYIVIVALLAGAVELLAVFTALLADDLFDHRSEPLARISDLTFPVPDLDSELGWVPSPGTSSEADCLGSSVEYFVAADGARAYPGYNPDAVRVVVGGDSYTFGSEASNGDAYPAVLAQLLNVSVANLGVGGYDPVQGLLRLERRLGDYPGVRTVVLGIMYENVHRMVNSYRPVLYDKADVLAFKPFMARGELVPHPGSEVAAGAEALSRAANRAFDTDFWRKPQSGFPYSAAVVRGFASDHFRLRKIQKRLRNTGMPEYALTYQMPEITDNLVALLTRFHTFADNRGIDALAVFMPRNRHDTESAREFLVREGHRLPDGLAVTDVGASEIDWLRYNLENSADDNICHPSTYGYREIATHVAAAI